MNDTEWLDWNIIEKSFNKKITEEESLILNKWLDESASHREYYNNVAKFFYSDSTENISSGLIPDNKKEFFNRCGIRKNRKGITHRLLYAASIIPPIIAILYLFIWQYNAKDKIFASLTPGTSKALLVVDGIKQIKLGDSLKTINTGSVTIQGSSNQVIYTDNLKTETVPRINTLIIPNGGEFNIVLSDGTKICLNSGSVLEFPDRFTGDTREVKLSGEAYFDVTQMLDKPFIVKTTLFNVKVTGTTFNINSYEDCSINDVTVESGRVIVSTFEKDTATLNVGQKFLFDKNSSTYSIQYVDPEIATAWKDGIFYFDKEPLKSILKKISRWYNIEIELNDLNTGELRFVGKITKYDNAGKVFEMLESTDYVKFKSEGNKIIVY